MKLGKLWHLWWWMMMMIMMSHRFEMRKNPMMCVCERVGILTYVKHVNLPQSLPLPSKSFLTLSFCPNHSQKRTAMHCIDTPQPPPPSFLSRVESQNQHSPYLYSISISRLRENEKEQVYSTLPYSVWLIDRLTDWLGDSDLSLSLSLSLCWTFLPPPLPLGFVF